MNTFKKRKDNRLKSILKEQIRELENSRKALLNMLEDTEEARKELENSRKALLNMLEDTEEARKEAEKEKEKTFTIITHFTDGLIFIGPDNRIQWINPRAERFLGINQADFIGKKIPPISNFQKENKKKVEETGEYNLSRIIHLFKHPTLSIPQQKELSIEKPRSYTFMITNVALYSPKKEFLGSLKIIHDITREKTIDRLKTEFISIAAHQLRTPLSAIKWSIKSILDGDYGKISLSQRKILQKTYKANEEMIILIRDLLDVARIEEGRAIYKSSLASIEKLIEEVIYNYKKAIKEKRLNFKFIKPKKPLPKIKIDAEKISLVISNILNNAIKYTPKGGQVTISLKREKKNIKVSIKDTGVGIPSYQQPLVFTKFFRGANIIRKDIRGTGLGLFICKGIIEAHEGKIGFKSKENKGSTFWFELPITH